MREGKFKRMDTKAKKEEKPLVNNAVGAVKKEDLIKLEKNAKTFLKAHENKG